MAESIFLVLTAMILIAISSIRFAALGISSTFAHSDFRRRRSMDVSSLRQAAEIARLNSELKASARDSASVDWRIMEVAEIVDESVDCRSFYLVDPYGQALPPFRPGQHVMVRPALAGAYQTVRCYSLSSAPNTTYWRITVKREASKQSAARLANGGGLSKWLHDTIREGDCLLVGGPNGQFYLNETSKRTVVLLAAGVGITPLASMLRWLLENQPARQVELLYQAKDLEYWPLGSVLHTWHADFPKLRVKTFFSRAPEHVVDQARKELPGAFSLGKFDVQDVLGESDNDQREYYMCGPEDWMRALCNALKDAGVAADNLHWESFGKTSLTASKATDVNCHARTVRFTHSGVETQWDDPEQSVWELAREHGVELPSGCLSGVCGCCRVKLLAGEVEYDRHISLDLARDECLTCVAKPKTDLVIDA